MKTKLENYRVFYEVATNLSFSKASEKLFISQSAVSQAIKQLEFNLETTLFRRYAKGVMLTNEGEALFEYVEEALNNLNVAEKKLSDMKNLEVGTLSIGAGDTIASQFLLPYLEKFHTLYPHINLQVYNRTSLEMINLVKNAKVDIAFINLPIKDKDIKVHPCFPIHDIFVAGKNFKVKTQYTREEIASLPLILLERHANSRIYIDQQFKTNQIQLQPQIELGAHELLLQFAKIHLGIACVIKEFSQDYLISEEVKELKLKTPLPERSIGYAHHERIPLSLAAKEFLQLIK